MRNFAQRLADHARMNLLTRTQQMGAWGILILVGYQTRWAAMVLIVFIVLTIIFAHNFWTMEGAARAANQAHFYKNLGLIGGLLFLIALGSGRCSLDHRFSRS